MATPRSKTAAADPSPGRARTRIPRTSEEREHHPVQDVRGRLRRVYLVRSRARRTYP